MPSSFPKVVLNNMDPIDFKTAMESHNNICLAPYYNYAKAICHYLIKEQKLGEVILEKDMFIEDVIQNTLKKLYAELYKYDPEKGAAFSSYFYGAVKIGFGETKRAYGLRENHPVIEFDEKMMASMQYDSTYSCQEHGTPATFAEKQIPFVISFIKTLPYIKKRIIMAKFGIALKTDAFNGDQLEVYDSSYGYATELSEELAKEGIVKNPGAIKTMANELLNQLRGYLVERTGMSEREFHENLTQFIVVNPEQEEKDAVRRKLLNLDANSMSDNEAAWLLIQFLRN